jgi:multidrug efflux pump subunit AcrB
MEKEVTSPLEAGFSTIRGLRAIRSRSSDGFGTITLDLDKYAKLDVARFEVAAIIRQLYPKLPDRVSYPQISINRPDEEAGAQAFVAYSIDAPVSAFEIRELVHTRIEPLISALPAVDRTAIYGATRKEYLVRYDDHQLRRLSLSREDLIAALQRQFAKTALGRVLFEHDHITLYVDAPNEVIWHIPVKKVEDRLVFLNDIASIEAVDQEVQSYYRVNGKNAVTLAVYAAKNANTISLAKKVDAEIREMQKGLPPEFTILQTYNNTQRLSAELNKIYERTAYTLAILLLFIALLSRSVRYLFVTVLSLVANLCGAFLFYYLLGVEIQLYSLAGITISLGLIIDNSIVMIDHQRRQGDRKVFIPILASTLTTIGALSVIYFLDDKYKVNLIDFALVIIINLSVSLCTALFLIPALMEKVRLLPRGESGTAGDGFYRMYGRMLPALLRYKRSLIGLAILTFGLPFFLLPTKFERADTFWKRAYNAGPGSELYQEKLRPYLDKYLGGSFRLFKKYVFETAHYGTDEEVKLMVSASMEKGADVHQMNETFLELEAFLEQFPAINRYITTVYSGDFGYLEVFFHPDDQYSAFPYELKARLVRKAVDLGGINWNISGVGEVFNNGSRNTEAIDFSVTGRGYNYEVLNDWADSLKRSLEAHPRIKNAVLREPSLWSAIPAMGYRFELDREQLALKKSDPGRVFAALRSLTIADQPDLALNIRGQYMPVRLEAGQAADFDLWAIGNTPVDSFHRPVVMHDIARISREREEENIYKEDQEYTRLVTFQYNGSRKFGNQLLDEKLAELQTRLPLGYRFECPDDAWMLSRDKNNNYSFLLLLVLLIIYFICAILFESFKQPFIILSVIPISFIGVFLTFYLFRFDFDQGGLASFVLLSGITVNASIFILTTFKQLRQERPQVPVPALYLEAFRQKCFPIMLTVFSTLLGFIPFVKDGQHEVFWFALGAGTIGGLLFSMIGILIYLPLFTLKSTTARREDLKQLF